ncbi:hypothetical protein GTG28_21225 [Vibrio sp. OCN044]|uniref:Lipoprotein n=1 Tax=Vibrio tetraodonis subsp. pristinus TaxID=2695891 RepID=A0A6L8M058_9VIBR|nr:hypothetical protein [Vibrio tetraodonis]MYM61727.1 hypothetical protein [Vibrio tetraodonis subsp. pristinus]
MKRSKVLLTGLASLALAACYDAEHGREDYLSWLQNSQGKTISVMESPRHWEFSRSHNKPIVAKGELSQESYDCFVKAKRNLYKKASSGESLYMTYDEDLYLNIILTREGNLNKAMLIKGTKGGSAMFHLSCDINFDEMFTQ